MNKIKYKIIVLSGKGGVGKTTVAVNLAYALSKKGYKIGILDVDIHGPNVPKMVGLENKKLLTKDNKIFLLETKEGIKVISMAFILKKEDAVIWRGPLKHNLIRQFVEDVDWGKLDYLMIDFPPGTGDEGISISQLIKGITGSIIISTPQEVSLLDVVKAIDFSMKVKVPVIGLIENMSGDIFGKGNVKKVADKKKIEFLGSLELDKKITEACDKGKPFINSNSKNSKVFKTIVKKLESYCKDS